MKTWMHIFYILFYFTDAFSIRILSKPGIMIRKFPYIANANFSRDVIEQCDVPCVWTDRPENADAVFFLMMHNTHAIRAFRDAKFASISIGGSSEGAHYHSHLTNKEFWQHFDASALLATGSDIPWLTQISSYEEIQKVKSNPNPIKKGATVSFNCESKNSRERIVMEMDAIHPIDRIGKCLHNHPWPNCGDRICSKEEALRRYALCFAFENGDVSGYVTEKIHQCFRAGSLPVYLGTDMVTKYVPKGSFINMRDFPSHIAVAEYLVKVLNNDSLYRSYFEWKNKPLDPEFVRLNKPFWDSTIFCRVCRYVDVKKKGLTWDKETQNAVEYRSNEPIKPIEASSTIGSLLSDEIGPTKEIKNTQKRFIETPEHDFVYIKTFIQASIFFSLILITYILKRRGYLNNFFKFVSDTASNSGLR